MDSIVHRHHKFTTHHFILFFLFLGFIFAHKTHPLFAQRFFSTSYFFFFFLSLYRVTNSPRIHNQIALLSNQIEYNFNFNFWNAVCEIHFLATITISVNVCLASTVHELSVTHTVYYVDLSSAIHCLSCCFSVLFSLVCICHKR